MARRHGGTGHLLRFFLIAETADVFHMASRHLADSDRRLQGRAPKAKNKDFAWDFVLEECKNVLAAILSQTVATFVLVGRKALC